MEGRWVCQRCFESNNASAFTCTRCGLLRGATPPAGEAQWTSVGGPQAAGTGGGGGGWGHVLRRFGWIPVVGVIALAGYVLSAQRGDTGQITQGGNMAVADLRVGDCFDLGDPDASEFDNVKAVPCAEPHTYEMFYVEDVPGADYPGDDALIAWADEHCLPEFASFVGIEYEVSRLDIFWFSPSTDSWSAGDHSVQCALYDLDNEQVSGTLRGAAR